MSLMVRVSVREKVKPMEEVWKYAPDNMLDRQADLIEIIGLISARLGWLALSKMFLGVLGYFTW